MKQKGGIAVKKSTFVIVIIGFILISIAIVSYSININSIHSQANFKNTEDINLLFTNKYLKNDKVKTSLHLFNNINYNEKYIDEYKIKEIDYRMLIKLSKLKI